MVVQWRLSRVNQSAVSTENGSEATSLNVLAESPEVIYLFPASSLLSAHYLDLNPPKTSGRNAGHASSGESRSLSFRGTSSRGDRWDCLRGWGHTLDSVGCQRVAAESVTRLVRWKDRNFLTAAASFQIQKLMGWQPGV